MCSTPPAKECNVSHKECVSDVQWFTAFWQCNQCSWHWLLTLTDAIASILELCKSQLLFIYLSITVGIFIYVYFLLFIRSRVFVRVIKINYFSAFQGFSWVQIAYIEIFLQEFLCLDVKQFLHLDVKQFHEVPTVPFSCTGYSEQNFKLMLPL